MLIDLTIYVSRTHFFRRTSTFGQKSERRCLSDFFLFYIELCPIPSAFQRWSVQLNCVSRWRSSAFFLKSVHSHLVPNLVKQFLHYHKFDQKNNNKRIKQNNYE